MPRRALTLLTRAALAILVVRGVGGVIQDAVFLGTRGRASLNPLELYDLWFVTGAILLTAAEADAQAGQVPAADEGHDDR